MSRRGAISGAGGLVTLLDSAQWLFFRDDFLGGPATSNRDSGLTINNGGTSFFLKDAGYPNIGVIRYMPGAVVGSAVTCFSAADNNAFRPVNPAGGLGGGFMRFDNIAGWELQFIFRYSGYRNNAGAAQPAPATCLQSRFGVAALVAANGLSDTDSVHIRRNSGTLAATIAASPTGAVRSGNVVTITTTAAHGFGNGQDVFITGVTDASFNGSFVITSVPTSTTFTYAQVGANATSGAGSAFAGGDINYQFVVTRANVVQEIIDLGFRPDSLYHRWRMFCQTPGKILFQQDNGAIFTTTTPNITQEYLQPHWIIVNPQAQVAMPIDVDYFHAGFVAPVTVLDPAKPRWQPPQVGAGT